MSAQDLQPGDLFAGHRIEAVAGRGGMGVVYRARDLDLDRTVALKLIAASLADDPGFRERFIRESRVAASIDHPNVIPIFYAGDVEGRLFLAMRYVDGDDLRTLVRRVGRLPAARAARVVAQIGGGLDAAHARGIVHRDVKPANVLLGDLDHASLTDFGLTKRLHSASDPTRPAETRPGGWVGTLGYVAPEQIRSGRVDARTDVYALGCVLFHALTGEAPYARDTDEATLWAHLHDDPPSLLDRVPDLPPAFQAVVARALAKDPADRFPSAGDLGRAALAAAGTPEAVALPERVVATGAAAPAEPPVDQETVVSPASGSPPAATAHAPTAVAAAPPPAAAGPRRTPRPSPGLAGAAAVVAFAVGGTLLLTRGGEPQDPAAPPATVTATTLTTTTTPARPPEVAARLSVGGRPNDVVATRDRVVAISLNQTRASVFSRRTDVRTRLAPQPGIGSASVAAGFGSFFIAKQGTQSLLRYSLQTGARQGPAVRLPEGEVVAVDTGEGSVWAGSRPTPSGRGRATAVRIEPATGEQTRVVGLPRGLRNLTVGAGAVWVVDADETGVTRIDLGTGRQQRLSSGRGTYAVALGGGSVWITNSAEGTVTRRSSRPPYARIGRKVRVGRVPQGIDSGGGAVWVANREDGTATRIDVESGRVVGRPVRVGRGPFAVSVQGRSAYVTLLDDGEVARIDF